VLRRPTVGHEQPFLGLTLLVIPQRVDDKRADTEDADLTARLRSDESDRSGTQVNVGPRQCSYLTGSSAGAKHHVQPCLKPVAASVLWPQFCAETAGSTVSRTRR
jgi:hypothetical protein